MAILESVTTFIGNYKELVLFVGTIAALVVAVINIRRAVRDADRDRTKATVAEILTSHCPSSHEPLVKKMEEMKVELKDDIERHSPNGELKKIVDMLTSLNLNRQL